MSRRRIIALGTSALAGLAGGCARSAANGGFPGRRSRFPGGGQRLDFVHAGRPATLVVPARAAPGRPWLWRGEFFGAAANVDEALVARGWHLAYLDCKNTFGSPETMRKWDGLYAWLTSELQLSARPVLVGISRGGLYVYRWAALHPQQVALIYGDAPVCDVKSWPGGKGNGRGSPRDWRLFLQTFALTEEQALRWQGNPIDLLAPIARARIPLLHVVGDRDDVVPLDENTTLLAERYRRLGGRIEVWVKPGVGHHPHGYANPAPIVDFILNNALATAAR